MFTRHRPSLSTSSRARQRGLSLVMVAFVIGLMAMVALGVARSQLRSATEQTGYTFGNAIDLVSEAVNQYRTTNAGTLTFATPVLPGFANPMAPTIAELKAAGYLNTNVADTLAEGGAYSIAIDKTPAGCVGPSPTCNVWSRLSLANPLVDTSSGNPDIVRLSALISRIRESASYSVPGAPTTITGGNGAWTIPNPDPGNRPGILAVVAGLGGQDGPWLRVMDARNPDFRGPSVTGIQFDTIAKVIGTACSPQGAFASAADGIAYCNAGVWVLYNGQVATAGGACTTDGAMGHTPGGASLLCVSSIWRDHLTYGIRAVGYYAQNTTVPTPTCGAGLTPQAIVSGVSASVIIGANNPGNNTGSWQAEVDPTSWVVRIVGSDNSQAGTNARALVITLCTVT